MHMIELLSKKRFKAIIFDWDGTAVPDRFSSAEYLKEPFHQLLKLGIKIVIITGTNINNVWRQVGPWLDRDLAYSLYFCTNRGSEVFQWKDGDFITLERRVATSEEEDKLNRIAETFKNEVKIKYNLDVDIIYNRLNRRKIDLIPLPEWADPPKSKIDELLMAVNKRLKDHNVPSLSYLIKRTKEISFEIGLKDPRITSDVKHIEVGLTDKSDSTKFVREKLGVLPEEMLILGDEFGPIGEVDGSDYLMLNKYTKGATFISVGKEPNGVPKEVIHIGGGPEKFVEILWEVIKKEGELNNVGNSAGKF